MAEKVNTLSNYITLYHHNSNVKTIKEFIDREKIQGISADDFFELNRNNIFTFMTLRDKMAYQKKLGLEALPTAADLTVDMELPCPCNFIIDKRKVSSVLAISQTNLQVPYDDVDYFIDRRMSDIPTILGLDKIYLAFYNQEGGKLLNSTRKLNPQVTAFGWFKSAMFLIENADDEGTLSRQKKAFNDLSPYIISMSTLTAKSGGSWKIRLPFLRINVNDIERPWIGISYEGEDNFRSAGAYSSVNLMGGDWLSRGQTIHTYDSNAGGEFFSKSPNTFEDDISEINNNYFEWLISANDLIFMAFDKLVFNDNSGDDNNTNKTIIDINAQRAADYMSLSAGASGQVYEMIGLVDTVTTVQDPSTGSIYVEVTGRDLMKLLLDDGSFFFDVSVSGEPASVFANESRGAHGDILDADKVTGYTADPVRRLRRVSGEIDVFRNFVNMDISFILKGVISRLANIEVVPDYVFESWGDKRTKFVELKTDKTDEEEENA